MHTSPVLGFIKASSAFIETTFVVHPTRAAAFSLGINVASLKVSETEGRAGKATPLAPWDSDLVSMVASCFSNGF